VLLHSCRFAVLQASCQGLGQFVGVETLEKLSRQMLKAGCFDKKRHCR